VHLGHFVAVAGNPRGVASVEMIEKKGEIRAVRAVQRKTLTPNITKKAGFAVPRVGPPQINLRPVAERIFATVPQTSIACFFFAQ